VTFRTASQLDRDRPRICLVHSQIHQDLSMDKPSLDPAALKGGAHNHMLCGEKFPLNTHHEPRARGGSMRSTCAT
jgi:hypothetical protein